MRAIALAVLMVVVGCDKGGPTREELVREQAKAEAERARQEAMEKQHEVELLQQEIDALNTKLASAVDAVVEAQNDADRAAAKATLVELQREKADMQKHFDELRGQPKGLHHRQECQGNPLAKDCM